jgi:hypothetical protein
MKRAKAGTRAWRASYNEGNQRLRKTWLTTQSRANPSPERNSLTAGKNAGKSRKVRRYRRGGAP